MSSSEGKNVESCWPRQIKFIVGNEACERFSYYGMRSILAGYITGAVLKGGLGQDADASTEIIHLFVFANYFMPLFGAWLSDKIIGRYHTILWVSLFYCAGHGVLACSDLAGTVHGKLLLLYTGMALIAFGSGGIKPCVSAFVGDQFKPEQSHLLQKAYGAFYWSINIGSFFSFLVVPWVKDRHGYGLAFGVPGILMAIATFIFWLGTKHYVRVPPSRETKSAGFFKVLFYALANRKNTGGGARTALPDNEEVSGTLRAAGSAKRRLTRRNPSCPSCSSLRSSRRSGRCLTSAIPRGFCRVRKWVRPESLAWTSARSRCNP
jgi:POT family proton-dependent oligopeptide transporter